MTFHGVGIDFFLNCTIKRENGSEEEWETKEDGGREYRRNEGNRKERRKRETDRVEGHESIVK